jgi:hypothetical protein
MAKTMTRNTFKAVVKSIAPTIDRLPALSDTQAIAVASMILADADRIVGVLTLDDAERPGWAENEADHLGWAELAARIDALRDAYSGRTLSDLRLDTIATQRAVKRLTSTSDRARKVVEANAAAHKALDAIATAPAPARKGAAATNGRKK